MKIFVTKLYTLRGWLWTGLSSAQGIAAEIPEELRSNSEELERKARFLYAEHTKMRPWGIQKTGVGALSDALCGLLRLWLFGLARFVLLTGGSNN
jgi:hypothetical protein